MNELSLKEFKTIFDILKEQFSDTVEKLKKTEKSKEPALFDTLEADILELDKILAKIKKRIMKEDSLLECDSCGDLTDALFQVIWQDDDDNLWCFDCSRDVCKTLTYSEALEIKNKRLKEEKERKEVYEAERDRWLSKNPGKTEKDYKSHLDRENRSFAFRHGIRRIDDYMG